jgi:hypothetical protein
MSSTSGKTRLDTDPLTLNQLGAIHREFARLGFRPEHREERLRLTAIIGQVPDEIDSTKDLFMGEAGRSIGVLRGCRTIGELYAIADGPPALNKIIMRFISNLWRSI